MLAGVAVRKGNKRELFRQRFSMNVVRLTSQKSWQIFADGAL